MSEFCRGQIKDPPKDIYRSFIEQHLSIISKNLYYIEHFLPDILISVDRIIMP